MTIFDDIGEFIESKAKFTIKHIGVVLYTANDWGDSILHGEVIPLVADLGNEGIKSANKLSGDILNVAIEPLITLVKAAYSDVESFSKAAYSDVESFSVAVTYEF
jgi:hypothetical protein